MARKNKKSRTPKTRSRRAARTRRVTRKPARLSSRPQMFVMTSKGKRALSIRKQRTRKRISAHALAVKRFLKTGNRRVLSGFKGKSFTSRGQKYVFLTDPELIRELHEADEITFEHIYRSSRLAT